MNILLIGAGSIGKRHLANIISLGYNNISVVTSVALPPQFNCINTYKNVSQALADKQFDVAFICTPTANHVEVLKLLLQQKVENIYVEKPLSHTIGNVAEILALAAAYKNNIAVGYDLHFDPGIQKVRELMQQDVIGKTVSVNAFVGQYLPHWRPHEDHRLGMSAKAETGGGVILDLVHEFDYLCWLNGPVETVAGFNINTGVLEIETEECAEIMLRFVNNSIGTVHLDYLQQTLVRYCIVTGTKGTITCNLAERKVTWLAGGDITGEFSYACFERNDRFREIVRCFLQHNSDDRLTGLIPALQSLQIAEAAKYSSANRCMVKL